MATTAFVLSGGASLGAVQVGMLQALADHDVWPDVIVGASVGALNGAHLAGNPSAAGIDELAELWRSLRTRDIFPLRPRAALRGLIGGDSALTTARPLRRLLERCLRFDRLEHAPVPLQVIATDVLTGGEVRLSTGPAVEAVLASAAIPGVLPAVELDGRTLIDGGVANYTPVSAALSLGADRVYVLASSHDCRLAAPPRGAVAAATHAFGLLTQRQLRHALAEIPDGVDIRVPPPPCPTEVSPMDFRRTSELMDRSRAATAAWLTTPAPTSSPR